MSFPSNPLTFFYISFFLHETVSFPGGTVADTAQGQLFTIFIANMFICATIATVCTCLHFGSRSNVLFGHTCIPLFSALVSLLKSFVPGGRALNPLELPV